MECCACDGRGCSLRPEVSFVSLSARRSVYKRKRKLKCVWNNTIFGICLLAAKITKIFSLHYLRRAQKRINFVFNAEWNIFLLPITIPTSVILFKPSCLSRWSIKIHPFININKSNIEEVQTKIRNEKSTRLSICLTKHGKQTVDCAGCLKAWTGSDVKLSRILEILLNTTNLH